MKKPQTAGERKARIELLRARAAIERHGVARSVRQVRDSLSPRGLLKEALPAFAGGKKPVDLFLHALSVARRYPFLISGASAILTGKRSRLRWLKLGAGALLGWQLWRKTESRQGSGRA